MRNTTSNQVGVVVPYHCVNFRQDYQSVYVSQPYYPEIIGQVGYANSTIDLMFTLTNISVKPAVLHIENNTKYILYIVDYLGWDYTIVWSHGFLQRLGSVCKTGRTTGTTCDGVILGLSETCYIQIGTRIVQARYCIFHNLTWAFGDEGAPIYYVHRPLSYTPLLWNYTYVTLIGYHIGRDIYNRSVAIAVNASLENRLEPLVHNIPHRNLYRPLLAGTQSHHPGALATLSYPAINISSRQAGIVTVAHAVNLSDPRVFQNFSPHYIGYATWRNETIDSAFIVLENTTADNLILYSINDTVYILRSIFLVRWDNQGGWVGAGACKSGRTTGTTCDGRILRFDINCELAPGLRYCFYANFTFNAGDSGAPIFNYVIPSMRNYTWVYLLGHLARTGYYNGTAVGVGVSVEALIENGIIPLNRLVLASVYNYTYNYTRDYGDSDNYGRVVVEAYAYKLVPDFSTMYDWYFYEVRITIIPGKVLYGNSWETAYMSISFTRNISNTQIVSYGPLSINGFNNGSAIALVNLSANNPDNFRYSFTYRIPYINVTTSYFYYPPQDSETIFYVYDFNERFDPPGSPSDTIYTAIVGFVIRTPQNTSSLVYGNPLVIFGRSTSSGNWEYVTRMGTQFGLYAYYRTNDPIG